MIAAAVPSLGAVGPEWDALFNAGPGLQSRRSWFAATQDAALPPGAEPRFVLIRDGAMPAALFPMLAGPGRRMATLTTPYTCLYQPLAPPGASPSGWRAIGAAFGRFCRTHPVTLLEALDPQWPGLTPLLHGVRDAGLLARRFDHFGNWHQPVAGTAWPGYLASRPGPLRETIRRKTRLAERNGVRLELLRQPESIAPAMAAYETVHARSWKVPEPFPAFNTALARRAAAEGALRVGVMWLNDTPVAAQYWTVVNGTATILKLAHDDACKSLSPGTVLTAHVIRGLIEHETITDLDFGRGDDGYKRQWTSQRRQRIGVLLADPRRWAGLSALLRHDAGAALRSLKRPSRVQRRNATPANVFTHGPSQAQRSAK